MDGVMSCGFATHAEDITWVKKKLLFIDADSGRYWLEIRDGV